MSDRRTLKELRKQLFTFLATLDTPEKMEQAFCDLCTDNELDYMAQRIESARLLLEGATYQSVTEQVNVSSATLSRVSRCIKYGNGGYRDLLSDFLKEENE